MPTHRCSVCKCVKSLAEFYPRNDRGRMEGRCKACQKKRHRAWYARNKLAMAAGLVVVPETKHCWKCDQVKVSSEFGRSSSHRDGKNPCCKSCANRLAKDIHNPAREKRDPRGRIASLWTRYRLRPEEFQLLLERQNSACGICKEPLVGTPKVDHCHKTGRVRGLLCGRCNLHLAALDKEGFLELAMAYLNVGGGN